MTNTIRATAFTVVALLFCGHGGAQTVTFADSTIIQSSPYKIGLNIGSVSFYGSGQVYKNLLGVDNAGFEPLQLQTVWTQTVAGTTTTFTAASTYPTVTANRYVGASYVITASSTAALGCSGTITASTAGSYGTAVVYTLGTPCAAATSVGDTIIIKLKEYPTAEATWEAGNTTNGTWGTVSGGGKLTTDSTTPYDGVQSIVLDNTAGGSAEMQLFFDSQNNDRFVNLNGTYLMSIAAKVTSGSPSFTFSINRGSTTCSMTNSPGSSWAVYSQSCTFSETGSTSNSLVSATVTMTGTGKLEIDDEIFQKTSGQNSSNTSIFRDEVYQALLDYCGGGTPTCPIRDWLNQNGENLDNWIVSNDISALQTVAGDGGTTFTLSANPTPRLQEYLKLVQLVNGVPYLEVPVSFTTTDAANLIEFLESTNTSSGYGQKRANLGQSAPWVGPTGVFSEIYLSFCNECWNFEGDTGGQVMPYRSSAPGGPLYYYDYARRAGQVYAAMRADGAYNSSATHLGFNLQLGVNPSQLATNFAAMGSGAPDYVEQAPYTQSSVSNYQTDSALWGSALEEPYGNAADTSSSSGYNQAVTTIQSTTQCGSANTTACFATNYEQADSTLSTCGVGGNPSCTGGSNTALDQTHEDYITSGAGQGIIAPLQALLSMQLQNVRMQNYFALNEYSNNTLYSNTAKLWGLTVDMGGASAVLNASTFGGSYTPRPQMLGIMAANKAIIGSMYSCPISSVPTYNWAGDTVNGPTHALNNVPYIYAFCFKSGTTRSMVLINTSIYNNYTVGLSGTNPPTGTVTTTTYSFGGLDYMNDAAWNNNTATYAATVSNTTGSLSNPSTVTIPAVTEIVYSWSTGGASPAISLTPSSNPTLTFPSTNTGSTSASQTITVTNSGSAALTITAVTATSNYNVASDTCISGSPIAASGTCTIGVTFSPTTTGTITGNIQITNNTSVNPVYAYLTGTGTTGGYACTNTSADAAAIQSRVSAGGTLSITGTCDMTSTVTVTNAIQFVGGATFNGTVSPIFSVSSNSVGFTGFTFSGETSVAVQEITAGTPNQHFTFVSNTVQNTNGADGLDLYPIMQYAAINYNHFSYIAPNGFATSGTYGSDISGSVGILGLSGWDNSTIQYNSFDLTGADAIHMAWNEVIQTRYNFLTTNVSVSYNTFTRAHRMAIEAQGTTNYIGCSSPGVPANCTDPTILLSTNWKVAGNYASNFFQVYYNTYGYSLVTGNNGQIINNTATYNNWGSSLGSGCIAVAQETAGNTVLSQGNVYTSDNSGPANCTSYNLLTGWANIVYVLGAEGTKGGSTLLTVQNNYACSNGLTTSMVENETNGASLPRVEQYGYVAGTCPRAGSLTTSSMTPSYLSSSTTGGVTTFNFGVVSNLSLRLVTFYVDGTSIGTQELSDLNSSNFASTQQWLYHINVNPSGYASGSHSLTMKATDVSGTVSSAATTSFTGGGTTLVNIPAGTYTVSDSTASCSGSGVACNLDSGFALYGTNTLSLYQAQPTNANQQWTLTAGTISNTFTMCAVGIYGQTGITNACLIDPGTGAATLNGTASGNNNLWQIQTANGTTYYIKNYSTGNYIQDAATPANAATTTTGGTAYQWSFIAVSPSMPQTYYVSTSGSDSNNGLSPTTPWQTIAKVNSTTLVPGSAVLFNGGNTFAGEVNATVAGTSGNTITYGAYGSGLPIINASGNNYCLYASAPSYITVTTLECENATLYGIYANSTSAFSNFTATGLTVTSNGSNGIYVLSGNYSTGGAATNITVTNNAVTRNGGSGIKVEGYGGTINTVTVTGNVTSYNSQTPTTAIPENVSMGEIYVDCPIAQASCNTAINVSNNTVSYGANGAAAQPGGQTPTITPDEYGLGIWIDTLSNATVYNNMSHDNQSSGLFLEKTVSTVAYQNLAYNMVYTGGVFQGVCTIAEGPNPSGGAWQSTNNVFVNNTCVGTGKAAFALNFECGSSCTSGVDGMSGNIIQNNLFESMTSGGYGLLMSQQVNQSGYYTSNLNVFRYTGFGVPNTNFIFYAPNAYSTYAAFIAAFPSVASLYQSDPGFVSPSTNNYNLTSGSGARSYGTAYSSAYEPCGITSVDLGALPYACSSPLAITPSTGTIAANGTLTLTANGSSTWTVTQSGALRGQASVSTAGPSTSTVLSLAPGTYFSGQPITVTATSGSSSTTGTYYSTGGPYLLKMMSSNAGPLTVTPSATYATEGQTITLTASVPATFTAASGSVGTLTTTSATTATYTAPASISVQSPVAGCPMFPNDSILNTNISTLPVNSNSSAWLSLVTGDNITVQQAFPYNAVTGTPATWTKKFYYGATGGTYPLLSWPAKKRETSYDASAQDQQDHHQLAILVATGSTQCTGYETYNDVISPTYTYTCRDSSSGCNASSGDIFTPVQYSLVSGTDAAGLPQYLALRLDEIKANAIHHPTRITFSSGYIQGSSNPTLWPANVGTNNGGGTSSNSLPYGAILRLHSSFNISTYSAYAQNILNAFKNYGLIVADIGTTGAINTGTDVWEDPTVAAAVNSINGIALSNFDVIDTSSLMVSRSSYQVSTANSYVTPVTGVTINAVAAASSASLAISLQGVGIGFAQNQVALLPGSYTYNFGSNAWVTGSTNQSLTWSLVSGVGSVTSSGVYTPPTSVSSLSAVVLKATAAADTNISKQLYINVYPWNTDGNFRIAEGGNFPSSGYLTDSTSGTYNWYTYAGLETGIMTSLANDYPNWSNLSGNGEQNIYQAVGYTRGDDFFHRFVVPPGNYKIRLLMGFPHNGTTSCSPWAYYATLQIGAQSQIAAHSWIEGASTTPAYNCAQAFDFYEPAVVSSTGDLFFSVGHNNPDGVTPSNPGFPSFSISLSGAEIMPDSSAAHITIDTGMEAFNPLLNGGSAITQPLVVPHGTTAQLYCVGWYEADTCTWSVTGGGSINSSGLYTAPTSGTATATVTATSTVNSSTANATLSVT